MMNRVFLVFLSALTLFGCKGKSQEEVLPQEENVGRPIVLDYSTMWCGYCGLAAQEVDQVSEKYKDNNLLYVTVLIEDQYGDPPDTSDCNLWALNFKIENNPVLAGSRDLIGTPGNNDGLPVTGWPTFVFLREDLSIYSIRAGFSSQSLDIEIYNLVSENEKASD
jgi:thiol-disulfide isomerase/thioredoxin